MATITSIAGGAPKPVFDRLAPVFEKSSGHRLNALYDTMKGIAARVAAGEGFDVLVMPMELLAAYVADGTVSAKGCTALADIGLAVGVKAGAAMPDVSTADALRRALMGARAVVHAPPDATPSGAQSDKIIKTLGLADVLAARVMHKAGLAGGIAMVASGAADIGIFPKSEIANAPGVVVAGAVPEPLQLTIRYGAAVTKSSQAPEPAAAFIRFLVEPESRAIWSACGFDPPSA